MIKNMNSKNSDYRFQYIPEYIIRNWKDEDGNVAYFSRGESDAFTSPLADAFVEHLTADCDENELKESDTLSNTHIIDLISSIVKGDFSSVQKSSYWFSALLSHLYYSNPYGSGRVDAITAIYPEELKKCRDEVEVSEFLTKRVNEKRTTKELLFSRELASMSFIYFFDLAPCIIEACGEIDFVLGMNPVFIFNPSENALFRGSPAPFAANGAFMMLPLSPRYALCLYDSRCYRLKKNEGRVVLTEDDVILFNKIMAMSGNSFVFSTTEKYGDEYYSHLYEAVKDDTVESLDSSFSFIRVLAAAFSLDSPERRYACLLDEYDMHHLRGENALSHYEYEKRIKHALSLSSL